jgi:hypothetical protein
MPSVSRPVTNELPNVLMDVTAERVRQIEKGWTPEHDDTHTWEGITDLVVERLETADHALHPALRRAMAIQAIAVLCAAVEAHDRREARRV